MRPTLTSRKGLPLVGRARRKSRIKEAVDIHAAIPPHQRVRVPGQLDVRPMADQPVVVLQGNTGLGAQATTLSHAADGNRDEIPAQGSSAAAIAGAFTAEGLPDPCPTDHQGAA